MLELPPKYGISSTFNIFDLREYNEPTLIPSEPFEPDPVIESEPLLECPPVILPVQRDRVERILDDQAIATRNKSYQRYLVRWQGRPNSEDSWITREDLQQIDPNILERYHSHADPYSTRSSSSHSGIIDVDIMSRRRLQQGSLWLTV